MAWMIYGASGYTGQLLAREAARRGLKPVLAGRSAGALQALAAELQLPVRAFALDDATALDAGLAGIGLVLNAAGPFSATAAPMLAACLRQRAHYLDITGEIPVLEAARQSDAAARAAGVIVCPGVGFDVIPTDCVAAALKAALPDASHLTLGFDTRTGTSPGTAKTVLEGLAEGGQVRRDGRIESVPLAWKQRRIDFGNGVKDAMTVPWGDIATAYATTGIGNIEVYVAAPPRLIARARRANRYRAVLGWGWLRRLLQAQIGRRVRGPDGGQRDATPSFVWGEVRNPAGQLRTARLRTANGYSLTVTGALAVVEHLLERPSQEVGAGYRTPSQLMGTHFVSRLPGSGPIEISSAEG